MIRHVVMFRWAEGTPPEQSAVVAAALATLPGLIPEIRSYHFGPDAGLVEGNFDFAVVGDFDSVDDFHAYRTHPAHLEVIERDIKPHLAARAAVQHELG